MYFLQMCCYCKYNYIIAFFRIVLLLRCTIAVCIVNICILPRIILMYCIFAMWYCHCIVLLLRFTITVRITPWVLLQYCISAVWHCYFIEFVPDVCVACCVLPLLLLRYSYCSMYCSRLFLNILYKQTLTLRVNKRLLCS